jgi:hypothetical protein
MLHYDKSFWNRRMKLSISPINVYDMQEVRVIKGCPL